MRKIAIIPARGGSKRLPRKNILPVKGKPIITYPINSALESGIFDRVIVSTEDTEIEQIALESGAEVMQRPTHLAVDRATVVQVCQQVLESSGEGEKADFFCCIYATAILIRSRDLLNSFNMFDQDPKPDFVMGVSEFNLQPLQALEEKDGFLRAKWPEYTGMQSQFHPKLLASNGTLYWALTKSFLQTVSFYGDRLKGYVVPRTRTVDLDTPEDLKFARILAEFLL